MSPENYLIEKILIEKNRYKWKSLIQDERISDLDFSLFAEILARFLNESNSFFEFAKDLYFFSEDIEDKQSMLWIWIEDVSIRLDEEYAKFLLDLTFNRENTDLLDYLFDLLGIYYVPKIKETNISIINTDFFKTFIEHENLEVRTLSKLFLFQEQVVSNFPKDVLEEFLDLPEQLKERIITPLFEQPYDEKLLKWVTSNLGISLGNFSSRIKTAFITHILRDSVNFGFIFSKVCEILKTSEDKLFLETVLLYILPSELITQPFIDELLDVYIDELNLTHNLLVVQHLPQFFDEWPKNLQKKIVNMFSYSDSRVRIGILQLLSNNYLNEDLLLQGLYDLDKSVLNAAIQSAAIVFRKLNKEIKKKVINIIQSENYLQNSSSSFFIAFNFYYNSFLSKIKKILSRKNDINMEVLIQVLRGLILQWNDLPDDVKQIIINNTINIWPEEIKKAILQIFQMKIGALDDQAEQLIQFLSKKNFLPLELDVLQRD